MIVKINGHELSEAQKAVLRRGYMIINMSAPEKITYSDMTYREWERLGAAGHRDCS